MSLIDFPNAGAVGVNKDLSNHELPPNAWTDCQNIRFLDGYAWQFYGHGEVFGQAQAVPHHLVPVSVGGGRYWLYLGLSKAFAVTLVDGEAVHTDLTPTAGEFSAAPNTWTSTLLGGIPVVNAGNGVDVPHRWNLDINDPLMPLENWPADTYAKSLRSYKQFLVALGITKSGAEYPYMVKWSHPADPGGVPISWAIDDPKVDAGEVDLAEGYDPIVDGLQLRDSFIIYKEASVWRMDFTGGPYVFSFKKVLGVSGALNRNCIVEVDGWHFVLTGSDVIVHDGQTSTSVLDKMSRRYLFQNIDTEHVDKCFVFKNPFLNEVFVCYPEPGNEYCNRAMVWNYVDKTVCFREIPRLTHASFGPVDVGLEGAWDQDDAPWASDLTAWNGPDFTPSRARALMASADQKLFLLDASSSFAGQIPQAYLERRGLSFGSPEQMKLIRGVRPRIMGNEGETVVIRVGAQSDPWGDPVYGPPMAHVIGSTVANDCFVQGRYITIRFETGTAYQWRLDGFQLDVEGGGRW